MVGEKPAAVMAAPAEDHFSLVFNLHRSQTPVDERIA